jgi:RND family efflux transporter MFP subunit
VLGAAVILLLSACGRNGGKEETRMDPPPPPVTTTLPVKREVVDWDEYTGRLASPETVEIRSRVSGYLQEVHFTEGAEVTKGDLLFTIDPRPYEAMVQRMEALVTSAKSRADLAIQELENVAKLRNTRAISAEDYERRAKAATDASGLRQAAEAELRQAQLDVEFTQIRSPIAGRVSDARVTMGNLVTGGDRDSTLLTTVVSLDPIYCVIEIDERAFLKYDQLDREGARATPGLGRVEVEMGLVNENGFPHKGHIDFVDNRLDPGTGTIRSRAVFPNPDKRMSPGFFARVRVPASGPYEGLLIPDRAIADDQGIPFVWVVDEENVASYRRVSAGPLIDGLRVIREGIADGDRVVVDGLMAVRNGQKVDPQPLDEAK